MDDDVITVTSRSDSSHLHLYGPWVGVAAASRQIPAKMSQDSTTFWKETLGKKNRCGTAATRGGDWPQQIQNLPEPSRISENLLEAESHP